MAEEIAELTFPLGQNPDEKTRKSSGAAKQRRPRDREAVCEAARELGLAAWCWSGLALLKRYSVTTRPSGSASPVALPAIVWIGATLPLAAAAKPRIAFEPGLET